MRDEVDASDYTWVDLVTPDPPRSSRPPRLTLAERLWSSPQPREMQAPTVLTARFLLNSLEFMAFAVPVDRPVRGDSLSDQATAIVRLMLGCPSPAVVVAGRRYVVWALPREAAGMSAAASAAS